MIGYEISHGFDDQGRRLDAEGNVRDWWTQADAKKFKKAAKALVEQYNRYEPLPGLHVNGALQHKVGYQLPLAPLLSRHRALGQDRCLLHRF